MGGFEEESRVVLWTNGATGCRVVGARVAWSGSHCHIFEIPRMWQRRMLCGR